MKLLMLATFAGGCFWCMQPPFDHLPGIVKTTVGYTGGQSANPTYEQVCTGKTGHIEAIQVEYDPQKVSYEALLKVFWHNINPTTRDGQFADRGTQYRTVIYTHTPEQKKAAEASKAALEASGKFKEPIATTIEPAKPFYPAEEYHQCYYKRNSTHYEAYKEGSGRADYIRRTWKESKP